MVKPYKFSSELEATAALPQSVSVDAIQAGESSPACIRVILSVVVLKKLEENRCPKLKLVPIRRTAAIISEGGADTAEDHRQGCQADYQGIRAFCCWTRASIRRRRRARKRGLVGPFVAVCRTSHNENINVVCVD
jgi:hypothetical protein